MHEYITVSIVSHDREEVSDILELKGGEVKDFISSLSELGNRVFLDKKGYDVTVRKAKYRLKENGKLVLELEY